MRREMTNETRKYESPKRREQADATRRRIAASARRLFAERGYAATTIESIAMDAGVAVQTFYATYGSKRAVLFALLDQVDAEAGVPQLIEDIRSAAGDARRQLQLVVDFNVRLFDAAADIFSIVAAAGSADADIASLSRLGAQRRREGQAPVVHSWAQSSALKPGLSEQEAADILWVLCDPQHFSQFVIECGWPVDRFRDWLVATLTWALFQE